MKTLFSMTLALILTLGAGPGLARADGLRDHKQINEGLTNIAIADMIRKKCPTISARMITAYGYMRSLKKIANDEGYSDKEIEAFVTNKQEKARVEGAARAWLQSQGVTLSRPDSYCVAGHTEIDRNSQIGVLLRSK